MYQFCKFCPYHNQVFCEEVENINKTKNVKAKEPAKKKKNIGSKTKKC